MDDSPTLRCEPFCSARHTSSHCLLCKCAACGFCSAEAVGAPQHANLSASELLMLQVAQSKTAAAAARAPPPPPPKRPTAATSAASRTALLVLSSHQMQLCPALESLRWEATTSATGSRGAPGGSATPPALLLRLRQWDEGLTVTVFVRTGGSGPERSSAADHESRLHFDAVGDGGGASSASARKWIEMASDDDSAAAASFAGIRQAHTTGASAAFAAAAHSAMGAASRTSALSLPPGLHAQSIRLRQLPAGSLPRLPDLRLSSATPMLDPQVVCVAQPPRLSHAPLATPAVTLGVHSSSSVVGAPADAATSAMLAPQRAQAPLSAPDDDDTGWDSPTAAPSKALGGGSGKARSRPPAPPAPPRETHAVTSLYLIFILLVVSLPLYLLYAARSQLLRQVGASHRNPSTCPCAPSRMPLLSPAPPRAPVVGVATSEAPSG